MIKTDVIISIYFRGILVNEQFKELYHLFVSFCKENGISSKVKVKYIHKDIWKNKSSQYSEKKAAEIEEKILENELVTLEIYKIDDVENPFESKDISFGFSLNQPITVSMSLPESDDNWGHIDFILNSNNWTEILGDSLIETIARKYISIISNGPTRVVYGLVLKMPRNNSPTYYAAGLNVISFNEEQQKEVTLLDENKKIINTKIWQPFLGNIITEKHFKSESHKKELIDAVGKENVISVGEKTTFFKMPIPITEFEYNSADHKKYKKIIHEIFAKYDAILL